MPSVRPPARAGCGELVDLPLPPDQLRELLPGPLREKFDRRRRHPER
ncbi:hypothetical protein ACFY2R_03935 [Micromonospora olivasterospora]|uniref:Uncharacterized protein n=1 Tax=Micromonospora olivasterospora TaxID=1880 RepID=A0A562IEG6_MICOL|nr:hypothetical protein [Micromonospora olivasterospora]TWH69292.1 hypothetical protein JD77_04301 [Micromonospora olivasterospora]